MVLQLNGLTLVAMNALMLYTHFAFYGDPTINVYQIESPSNVHLTQVNGNVQLNWDSLPIPELLVTTFIEPFTTTLE